MFTALRSVVPIKGANFARMFHSSRAPQAGPFGHVRSRPERKALIGKCFERHNIDTLEKFTRLDDGLRKVITGLLEDNKNTCTVYDIPKTEMGEYTRIVKAVTEGNCGARKDKRIQFLSALIGKKIENQDLMEISITEKGNGEAHIQVFKNEYAEVRSHRVGETYGDPMSSQPVARVVIPRNSELEKYLTKKE